MWNLVGFQTRLRIPEQQRVFRMIPGLEDAEFLRYGSIHRNSVPQQPGRARPRARRRATTTASSSPASSPASRATPSRSAPVCWRGSTWRGGSVAQPAAGPAADHDARRALPLPPGGRPGALPADERQLRPARAAATAARSTGRRIGRRSRRWWSGRARTSHAWLATAVSAGQRAERGPAPSRRPAVPWQFLDHLEKERQTVAEHRQGLSPRPRRVHRVPAAGTTAGDWTFGHASTGSASADFSVSCSAGASPSARRRGRSRRCGASIASCRCTTGSGDEPGSRGASAPRLGSDCPATWIVAADRRALRRRPRRERPATTSARLRDLAMLELFYSTRHAAVGAAGLDLADLDLLSDQVKVRGKGRKERIVPVGARASAGAAALSGPAGRRCRPVAAGRPAGGVRGPARPAARAAERAAARAPGVRRDRWARGCGPTRCGTRSRPTCSTPAPTCGPCRSCWVTRP